MNLALCLAVGCLLGAGNLLVASPFLWPRIPGTADRAPTRTGRMRERLELAGLRSVSPAAFYAVSGVLAVGCAAIVQGILRIPALSVIAGAITVLLPAAVVSSRGTSRRRSNRSVWPDVVDQLVSAVRSGLALPDGVSALARTGPEATRESFAAFERDYRSSGNFSDCVERLKRRLADPVADRILETLRMAREVGGSDLTTVLRSLAAYLREETAIRQEVEARQSWVLNAGKLGVAAPWIVLLLLASRPEARLAYNTQTGTIVIVAGLLISLIAYRVMGVLGHLPEERRWFQ